MSALTVGSLCSGIGGLDLGLERAGMVVRWQAETDPYCSRVLAEHWPGVPNHGDVTTIDWSTVDPVDVVCAGYLCQPFSDAGRRRGADDPRHLWPFVHGAVRHLRPRFVVLENVAGHLRLGFDVVLADLAALGFHAEWSLVSACSVGASHMRRRLFVVAYPAGEGPPWGDAGPQGLAGEAWGLEPERLGRSALRPPDGVEPGVVGRTHGIPDRVGRVRALGNAVVLQVAERVGCLIVAADALGEVSS